VRLSVLLFLLAITPAAWSQVAGEDPGSPRHIIDQCSRHALVDEAIVGLTALEEKCPGLTRALEESGHLALLSTVSRATLDAYDLGDFEQIDDWYAEPAARNIDVDTLGPILESLQAQEPERPLTWFERFKRWLRTLLERPEGSEDNWLSRWLEGVSISEAVARVLTYLAIALILGLTVAVIVNELRVAGVFRRRRGAQEAGMIVAGAASAVGDDAADLDSLPVDRKAQALLRMLITALVQTGRLRTERSLTHRELCARAAFDNAGQRESFRRVAALAERTVYGSRAVPPEEVEAVVAATRSLDAQLRGAPA
jgi:hypothetical protein